MGETQGRPTKGIQMITRIVALILLLCQMGTAAAGPGMAHTSDLAQSGSALSAESEATEESGGAARVILPPGQQELGEVLKEVAAAEGIGLEVEILTGEQGYLQALIAGYGEKAPDIYWASDEADAKDLYDNGILPVNMRNPEGGLAIYSLSRMTPIETRILDPRNVYGLPVGIASEGTLVNIDQLASLLGTGDLTALQRDLTFCSYEEWVALCEGISAYLAKPAKTTLTLSGSKYTMPRYRPENAQRQRGLYAMATGQPASLLQNTLTAAFATAYQDPAALMATTQEEMAQVMAQPMRAVFGRLAQDTLYMTQSDGPLTRGEGYAETEKISAEAAEELFIGGTALFLKGDTQTGMRLQLENPALDGRLVLIPNKLPLENENVAVINEMFGISARGYLCVGESAANKQAALDLLVALFTTDTGTKALEQRLHQVCFSSPYPNNLLQRQLMDALSFGNVYPLPASTSSLTAVATVLGEWASSELMSLEEWGEEQENSFVNMAQGTMASLGISRAA